MADVETYIVESDGLPVDLMIWRRFRRPMPGLVERVLAMNPGLADAGPLLAAGTKVTIPIDAPAGPPVVPVIKLWD